MFLMFYPIMIVFREIMTTDTRETYFFLNISSLEWGKVKKVAKRVVKGQKRPKKPPPMVMDGTRLGLLYKNFFKSLFITYTSNVLFSNFEVLFALVNGGASFRWSFSKLSAWGSIESTAILTTHSSLYSP